MFGYIIVNKQELKFREFDVYQSYYCGLCQSLKERFGRRGQLTLSYDMTFVALLQISARVAGNTGIGHTQIHFRIPGAQHVFDDTHIALTYIIKQTFPHRLCTSHICYRIPCKYNSVHWFKYHLLFPPALAKRSSLMYAIMHIVALSSAM